MSFLNNEHFSDYLSDGEMNRMMEGTLNSEVDPLKVFDWELTCGNVPQTGTQLHSIAYEGDYNFRFAVEESNSRSSYQYSSNLNRLYIDMNKVARIKFMWTGPSTLHVRAMLIYKEPDFEKIAVSRCRMHEDKEDTSNNGYNHPSHVLRCDDERAIYAENEVSGRRSVITILDNIPQGADGVTVLYRLMCKTSCVGGINRRKTDIIFTLEDSNNQVVGRALLGVKVCSCPRRDKEKDEANPEKKRKSDQVAQHTPPKMMKTEAYTNDEQCNIYQVRVPQSRSIEFETLFSRWIAGATLPDEAVHQASFGAIMKL